MKILILLIVIISFRGTAQDTNVSRYYDTIRKETIYSPYKTSPASNGLYFSFTKDNRGNVSPLFVTFHYYGPTQIKLFSILMQTTGPANFVDLIPKNRIVRYQNGVYESYTILGSDFPNFTKYMNALITNEHVKIIYGSDFKVVEYIPDSTQRDTLSRYFAAHQKLFAKTSLLDSLANKSSVTGDTGVYAVFAFIAFAILLGVTLDRRRRDKEKKLLKYMSDMKIIRLAQEAEALKKEKETP